MTGASAVIVLEVPWQSTANTVVPPSWAELTRRRYPKRPTESKVIPFGLAPLGRSAKRYALPFRSTAMTPGDRLGSIANVVLVGNEHPDPTLPPPPLTVM
jgi:hypothetical protein